MVGHHPLYQMAAQLPLWGALVGPNGPNSDCTREKRYG
jgi:hypothetical protein